jgi:hypothetical protein
MVVVMTLTVGNNIGGTKGDQCKIVFAGLLLETAGK